MNKLLQKSAWLNISSPKVLVLTNSTFFNSWLLLKSFQKMLGCRGTPMHKNPVSAFYVQNCFFGCMIIYFHFFYKVPQYRKLF